MSLRLFKVSQDNTDDWAEAVIRFHNINDILSQPYRVFYGPNSEAVERGRRIKRSNLIHEIISIMRRYRSLKSELHPDTKKLLNEERKGWSNGL